MPFENWKKESEQLAVGGGFENWQRENVAVEDEETGSYAKQLLGSFVKGGMRIGEAVLQMPKHAVWLAAKVGGLPTDRPLQPGDPGYLLQQDLKEKPTTGVKLAELHTGLMLRHQEGVQKIVENHPEWDYDPPENFVDLLTSPRKLSLVIAESTPVFIGAGIMTAGGRPDVGLALMYATEGQDAYNQAVADGATEDEAQTAYHLYGSVSAIIEYLQLRGILKVGKGAWKNVLGLVTKKIAGKGLKAITKDIVTIGAQEAIEEIAQGTWQETVAKIVYDKSIPGGLWDFIDRRAQEGLVGFTMGLIPGVGGAGAAAIRGRLAARPGEVVIPVEPVEEPVTPTVLANVPGIIAETHNETGGSTINLRTGKPITSGFAVTVTKEFEKILPTDKITEQDVLDYQKEHADFLKKNPDAVIGTWVDEGKTYLDISRVVPTQEEAFRIGKENKQKAIFDLSKFETIAIPEVIPTVEPPVVPKAKPEAIKIPKKMTRTAVETILSMTDKAYAAKDIGKITQIKKALSDRIDEALADGRIDDARAAKEVWVGVDQIIFELDKISKAAEAVIEPEPKRPAKLSRKKALKLGHQLPKTMGWDDAQRRDFMQELVGKSSMKNMTPKELRTVVETLQSQARDMGLMPEEDFQKTMFIGTREVNTGEYIDAALAQVEELPNLRGVEPKIVTRRVRKRGRGLAALARDILVGVDNLSIPHLMRKIGGIKEGPMKEVGVDGWRRNVHRVASVFRGGVTQLNEALDAANVTPNNLAEMSRSLDPRLELIKRGREIIGKPKTRVYTFKINDKQYQLNMGELADIYLSAQQEQGLKHITKFGLNIFGVRTGPIDEATLKTLTDVVDGNPNAKAFTDAVVKIAEEYNAPQINYTHKRVNPESIDKLADRKNYWHLEVDVPRRIRGKGTYQISLLENKGILKPLAKPFGALVVRDAFPKFFSIQYSVAEYVGMAEELRAMNLLLNYEPIINQLEKKGYKGVRNNIKQLVEWTQDKRTTTVRADALLSRILHGSFRAVLHYSPEVIASQYMSTGHYAGVTPRKYHHLLLVPPRPALIKEMLEHNDIIWLRYYAGGQSAELAEVGQLDVSLRLLAGKHADLNRTGIAAQTTDLFAFAQGWKVAKAIITDTTDLKPGTTEFFDVVNDKVEELWDTQPSWDKWNKSINTSQRGIKRLPFLFRSYFEKSLMMLHTANATYEASGKTVTDKAAKAQVYGAVMGSQMATALMRTFIGWAVWRQRKTVWDYLAAMLAAPFVMVSIVGGYLNRIVGNMVRILAGQKQAYEGEPISSLPTQVIEWLLIGIGQAGDAAAYYFTGEEEKAIKQIKHALRNLTISIGTMRGLPIRQVEKGIKAATQEDEEEIKLSRKR